MTARAFSRKFPCFTDNDLAIWTGLLGIDLETKPGAYRLELIGIDTEGPPVNARGTLVVAATEFRQNSPASILRSDRYSQNQAINPKDWTAAGNHRGYGIVEIDIATMRRR